MVWSIGRNDKWYKHGRLSPHFNGKLRGYAGLTNTAKQIAEYIPKCKLYVEPFAGLGRVAKNIKSDKMVLNDISPYAINYLEKHFDAEVTNEDFEVCIRRWDSIDTFFLIDPPWSKSTYEKDFEDNVDRKGEKYVMVSNLTPTQYYQKLLEILPTMKGNWILCSNHSRKIKHPFHEKIVISPKKLMGFNIKTKLISNLPFEIRGPHTKKLTEMFN